MFHSPARLHASARLFAVVAVLAIAATAARAEDEFRLRAPQSVLNRTAQRIRPEQHELNLATPDYLDPGVETIRERYEDGKVKIERQVTLDPQGNYVNHGEWKLFNQTGEIVAEGHFDMGKRVGLWSQWHNRQDAPLLNEFPFKHFSAPFHSQATFVDGKMEGEWLILDSSQRKCSLISLTDGKRNGIVTTWLPNGTVYRQATYVKSVPVGDVLEHDAKTGELKPVASYLDGRKVTTKTANSRRGKQKLSEEQYLAATTVEKTPDDFWTLRFAEYQSEGEDLRHGFSKTWYENGILNQDGQFEYGKKQGTFTYHYENGQTAAKGEYVDDLPNDVWVWWHPNGQKSAVGKFRNGALISQWRWWDAAGQRTGQKTYDGSQMFTVAPKESIETGLAPTKGPTR